MSRPRMPILAVLFLGLVALTVYSVLDRGKKRVMTIDATGSPGLRVHVKYEADGVKHESDEDLPHQIAVTAHELHYEIRKLTEPADLTVKTSINNVQVSSVSTGTAGGGVSGHVKNRLFGEEYDATSFVPGP